MNSDEENITKRTLLSDSNKLNSSNKQIDETAQVPLEQETEISDPNINLEQEEPASTFLDKFIAFLVLIYPFSKFIEFLQDQLHDRLPQSISNISVLIGIIGFLVAIGWLAKIIYTYRLKLSSK